MNIYDNRVDVLEDLATTMTSSDSEDESSVGSYRDEEAITATIRLRKLTTSSLASSERVSKRLVLEDGGCNSLSNAESNGPEHRTPARTFSEDVVEIEGRSGQCFRKLCTIGVCVCVLSGLLAILKSELSSWS